MRSSSISMRTPVRMGRVSSLLAAMITWDTAWAKASPGTVPLMVGNAGKRRVFGLGHGGQVEAAAAAGQRDFVAIGFHLHRSGRKAAADVRKKAAGDQDGAFVADVRRDFQPGRGLVVEAREAHGAGFGLQKQAGKHRNRRPRRQRPGCPGDGFCQDVPFDSELHGRVPPFIAAAIV